MHEAERKIPRSRLSYPVTRQTPENAGIWEGSQAPHADVRLHPVSRDTPKSGPKIVLPYKTPRSRGPTVITKVIGGLILGPDFGVSRLDLPEAHAYSTILSIIYKTRCEPNGFAPLDTFPLIHIDLRLIISPIPQEHLTSTTMSKVPIPFSEPPVTNPFLCSKPKIAMYWLGA